MIQRSIKSKLLLSVSVLVISSGLLLSLLVTKRYGDNLLEAVTGQAENLGHAVALQAADKVLINDLVALQKMLDHQMRSHDSIAYLFIVKEGRVIAHTFPKGLPERLLEANAPESDKKSHLQTIESQEGKRYLDVAWPIFEGKAGVLRLGFSEEPLRQQLNRLWLEMGAATAGILLLAVTGSLVFVRRITKPLGELAAATRKVERGDLDIEVKVQGDDEVAALGSSFNLMVGTLRDYTERLEQQTMELERRHIQTRTFCEIVREIGALPGLREIAPSLIGRLQQILMCNEMVLLLTGESRDAIYVLSRNSVMEVRDPVQIDKALTILQGTEGFTRCASPRLEPPVVPGHFLREPRQAVIPVRYENHLFGALVVACPANCECDPEETELAGLILTQAAGVLKRAMMQEEAINDLQRRIEVSAGFGGIIGKDPKMQTIYRLIEEIAPTDATVLIQGESGTGKELVARAVHDNSARKDGPFVVINCSAYPDTLLESELFGHEKGAFTGAIRQKAGRFEQADGGTVFLDEVGEIAPQAQIKLLRVLQTQRFERLGGERTLSVNVRVIAATNRDLLSEVQMGRFREDLFYRLNVIPLNLPPLRDRRNDVPILANHFLRRFASEQGRDIREFSGEAMRTILNYSWPGNVRELENSVEHAAVLAKGTRIQLMDLPATIRRDVLEPSQSPTMEQSEQSLLRRVLVDCGWNKKEAARRLGIGRSTLYAKLRKYHIEKPMLQ